MDSWIHSVDRRHAVLSSVSTAERARWTQNIAQLLAHAWRIVQEAKAEVDRLLRAKGLELLRRQMPKEAARIECPESQTRLAGS